MAWRNLKANKGEWGPSTLLFADSETVPVTEQEHPHRTWHVLQCVCGSGGRFRRGKLVGPQTHEGTSVEGFWEWVASNLHVGETTQLYFHHWSFDCEALRWRERLESGEYLLSARKEADGPDELPGGRTRTFHGLWVDEGPPGICSVIHHTGARLVILDSMNWLPESLERIGAGLGMLKVPLPLPHAPLEKWFRRCRQDVAILQRAVLATINTVKVNRMGNLRYTAAGQSFALYRHRLMPTKIVLHDERDVARMERAAYYGGRVELYFRGPVGAAPLKSSRKRVHVLHAPPPPPTGPVYELDASALYPAVMRDGFYPRKLVDWWFHSVHGPRAEVRLNDACIADVLIQSDTHSWPCRMDNRVFWCTGTFRTTLAGTELMSALKLGHVKYCFAYAKYALSRLFREWAQECWDKRIAAEASGRPLEARLWKHLMASLHGKFAQRTAEWELLPGITSPQKWGQWIEFRAADVGTPGDGQVDASAKWDESGKCWRWIERRRSLGGQVERESERVDCDHDFVAISAYVSAAARERVRDWMELAGKGNVLACHTDALLVTREGYQRLKLADQVREREMGYLRLKAEGDTADLITCGHYRLGERWCRAGISFRAVKLEDGSYIWERFRPLSSAVDGEPGPGVLVYTRHCKPTQRYTKGIVDESGWIAPYPMAQEGEPTGARVV